VGTLTTTDPDAGQLYAYTLTSDGGGLFRIPAGTNTLLTNAVLLQESTPSVDIQIQSIDNGSPPLFIRQVCERARVCICVRKCDVLVVVLLYTCAFYIYVLKTCASVYSCVCGVSCVCFTWLGM
jgi:hypothetical protein